MFQTINLNIAYYWILTKRVGKCFFRVHTRVCVVTIDCKGCNTSLTRRGGILLRVLPVPPVTHYWTLRLGHFNMFTWALLGDLNRAPGLEESLQQAGGRSEDEEEGARRSLNHSFGFGAAGLKIPCVHSSIEKWRSIPGEAERLFPLDEVVGCSLGVLSRWSGTRIRYATFRGNWLTMDRPGAKVKR